MTKKKFCISLLISLSILCFEGKAQLLSEEELKVQPIYTSIEAALLSPERVYRLHLKGNLKQDSLPEAIFQFVNLQELSLRRCRLQVINGNIGKLTYLQHLDLDNNRLVRLPSSICNLKELQCLVISRNLISSLPEEIGKMTKLERIDAWENPLYVLPDQISLLSETLRTIDLRQIGFRKEEIEHIETLLPKTTILYTNLCDCKNGRE